MISMIREGMMMITIPTTVEKPLLEQEVKTCEEDIVEGDYSKIRPYVWDAISHYPRNIDELHRRRMFIARNTNGTLEGVYAFALLSAFMDDLDGWNVSIKHLTEDVDPGFGLLVYRFIYHYGKDQTLLEKWSFLIAFSKEKGHIEATRIWWEKKLLPFGIAGTVFGYLLKAFLAIKSVGLALINPSDPRLPKIKD